MKAPGCSIEAWGGAIAIDSNLDIYDHNTKPGPEWNCICSKADLKPRQRRALAIYMMKLWAEFGDIR